MASLKTRPMAVDTPVLVFGLEQDMALNDEVGEVQQAFDGNRYAIKLANGARVRVTPDKCAQLCPRDFVEHARRLTTELCVFARTNFGGPTSLISFDAAVLGKGRKALSPKLDRIELCSAHKMLRLYKHGADTAYAQLKNVNVSPSCATFNITVLDFDVPTAVCKPDIDADIDADVIAVSCRNSTFFFENRVPMYHMTHDHMLSYMSERAATSVINNYFEIVRYLSYTGDVEHVHYDPTARILVYKLDSVRSTIVSPLWKSDEFMVAHHGHMTGCRIAFMHRAACSAAPARNKHVFPIGSVAIRSDHTAVTIEENDIGDDTGLTPSVDMFLPIQLALCAHVVEYGVASERKIEPFQRQAATILMHIGDMLRDNSHNKCARMTQNLLKQHICNGTNFLLPAPFMNDIYENAHKSTAWLANLEALCNAFSLVLDTSMNAILSFERGLFKVSEQISRDDVDGITVYVASFANNPIENQAWIFQRELDNIDDTLQKIILEQIQHLPSSFKGMHSATNVGETAAGGDAEDDNIASIASMDQQAAVDDTDALMKRSLKLQAELIEREEEEASVSAVAAKKKKKKRGKTKTSCTESLLVAMRDLEAELPSPQTKPSDELSRELHKVQRLVDDNVAPNLTAKSAPSSVMNDYLSQDVAKAVELADFVHVVGSRASARAASRLKQDLTVAQQRIDALETERATFATQLECELDKQRTGFREENAKIAHEVAAHDAAFDEMRAQSDRALAERDRALAERDRALAERDSALAERDSALAERDLAVAFVQHAHRISTMHMTQILANIANQLRRYLAGHYMKLDPTTISIAAVCRDGFVAMLLINLYREFVDTNLTADEVVALAVHTTSDMALTSHGGVTLVAPSH